VELAMDRVIMRFGPGAVRPASLVEPPHDEMGL